MSINVTQIRSTQFNERITRSSRGDTGVREYLIEGATSMEEVALAASVPGLPSQGDPWSPAIEAAGLLCVSIDFGWFTTHRDGEALGRIKATVNYGPPEFSVLNNEAAPTDPGQRWTECDLDYVSQQVMFANVLGTQIPIPEPINNGRGVDIRIGLLNMTVCKTYAKNAVPQVAPFLALVRPPMVNAMPFTTPPLWGHDGGFEFAAGQLLYQGFKITSQNGLKVVRHSLLASENWNVEWTVEDAKGQPRASYTGAIYDPADFSVLL